MVGRGDFTDFGHLLILLALMPCRKPLSPPSNILFSTLILSIQRRMRAEMDAYSAHDTTSITQELAGREGVVRRRRGSLQGRGRTLLSVVR